MSSQQPYWANDNETRYMSPAPTAPAPTATSSNRPVKEAFPRAQDQGPALIAGKFDATHTVQNLAILAGLAGVITFAVIIVVDQVLGRMTDSVPQAVSSVVVTSIITVVIGVLAGLLYIPVVDTGNENLFGVAIVAVAVAAAAAWVVFGGLLDGEWSTIRTLAAIVCTTIAAYAAPSRIDAARVN
jgi:drug/metabolite transporter (DMT)-like permease